MRLSEIQMHIEKISMEGIYLKLENHGSNSTISNIIKFKEFLKSVQIFPFYAAEVTELYESDLYSTGNDSITVNYQIAASIKNYANYLITGMIALRKVLDAMNMKSDSDEKSIFIKLPSSNDLKELISTLSAFEQSINQVIINDTINGYLQIERWESGSFWVKLVLGSQAAVFLIGSISWSAAVINKKYQEGRILEQQVRALNIKSESLEDLLNTQKKATDLLIKNEVEAIQIKHFQKGKVNGESSGSSSEKEGMLDPEQFERLKMATKTFAELIQKGSEIHPALTAPEKVDNLFPDFNQLDSVTSKIGRAHV